MPYRKNVFADGEIYHVFNRGIAKGNIFRSKRDYSRAKRLIDFYRFTHPSFRYSHYERLSIDEKERFEKSNKTLLQERVEILAFCLMPNHVHFLIKQKSKKGISKFMSDFQNSHSKYYNLKYDRTGSLFQAMFKAVHIEDDSQLMQVSRYIHLNPVTAYIIEENELGSYDWCSYGSYVNEAGDNFLNIEIIKSMFKNTASYRDFVMDHSDYSRKLAEVKHLIFD